MPPNVVDGILRRGAEHELLRRSGHHAPASFFERFFPGRDDVVRLLMEPITYANGSTLEDPALTYGIVFSNFMSKGVYTFQGGTDRLIELMGREMRQNGVDLRTRCPVEKIHVAGRRVRRRHDRRPADHAPAVVSNANLLGTILHLVGAGTLGRAIFSNKPGPCG